MLAYRHVAAIAVLLVAAGLAACVPGVLTPSSATPTPAAPASPSATPAPTQRSEPELVTAPSPTGTPEPTETPTPELPTLVVTETPTTDNIITLAARYVTATYDAATTGTPTPLKARLVTITVPLVVTATETPANEETAVYIKEMATAAAFLYGTATPLPPNAVTATPEPTDTRQPLLLPLSDLTPSPVPTAKFTLTPTPSSLPEEVRGKILFLTDRYKKKKNDKPKIIAINPDGSDPAILTDEWVYERAEELNRTSVHGQMLVVQELSLWTINPDGWKSFLFDLGWDEYDPAWAPDAALIAFVSNGPGNDEIFLYNKDTGKVKRLTHNEWEWDKQPSFSPDGKKIAFMSNRETGRQQIWVMSIHNDDDAVNISNSSHNDWGPVWVK